MTYTAAKPRLAPDRSVLERTIPGWGADLDPKDRPAVPKENFNPNGTGAHWVYPERQVATFPREKTTEHPTLTPVFGTACPLKGFSGVIRRLAYRYSEGRTAHWMLLIVADRVDVLESMVTSALRGRPDNFFSEWGLVAEFKRHGIASRFGKRRSDVKHLPLDVVAFAVKGALFGAAMYFLGRGALRAGRGLKQLVAG